MWRDTLYTELEPKKHERDETLSHDQQHDTAQKPQQSSGLKIAGLVIGSLAIITALGIGIWFMVSSQGSGSDEANVAEVSDSEALSEEPIAEAETEADPEKESDDLIFETPKEFRDYLRLSYDNVYYFMVDDEDHHMYGSLQMSIDANGDTEAEHKQLTAYLLELLANSAAFEYNYFDVMETGSGQGWSYLYEVETINQLVEDGIVVDEVWDHALPFEEYALEGEL